MNHPQKTHQTKPAPEHVSDPVFYRNFGYAMLAGYVNGELWIFSWDARKVEWQVKHKATPPDISYIESLKRERVKT